MRSLMQIASHSRMRPSIAREFTDGTAHLRSATHCLHLNHGEEAIVKEHLHIAEVARNPVILHFGIET